MEYKNSRPMHCDGRDRSSPNIDPGYEQDNKAKTNEEDVLDDLNSNAKNNEEFLLLEQSVNKKMAYNHFLKAPLDIDILLTSENIQKAEDMWIIHI